MEKQTKEIKLSELKKFIFEEAMKLVNAGDPMDVEMNQHDGSKDSTGAAVKAKENGSFEIKKTAPAKAENIEKTEETTEVEMNQNDKEGGSDEKIAAAVSVEATGSTKKGDSVEGMHNAKFDSKDKNPSTDSSEPFEERKEKVEMNSQDKPTEDGAKTYVSAGSEMSKGLSKGQAKANFSEKAKNEKEVAERIADAIQLPETFKSKKELLEFISNKAMEVSKILSESEMEEGLGSWLGQKMGLTDTPEVIQGKKDQLIKKLEDLKAKGFVNFQYDREKVDENTLMAKMEKNGFSGKLLPIPSAKTIAYMPGAYGAARLGAGGASQGLGI